MGKSKHLRVVFDDERGVFFAGQALKGKVVLDLKDSMKVRAITIRFLGRANVHWQEETVKLESHGKMVRGNEIYFDYTQTLLGKEPGMKGSNAFLSSKQHEFVFEFLLPPHLPSSFDDKYGVIRYEVFVTVDRIWNFDMKYKTAFTVIGIVDLNSEPRAVMPSQNQSSVTLTVCCFPVGSLSCTIKLPRSGYVPGEEIPLTVEIFNHTGAATRNVRAFLRQVVTFHANNISKKVIKNIIKIKKSKVPSGDCQMWTDEKLHIPPLPPSRLEGCKLIDIYYEVVVYVIPSGFMHDAKERVVVSLPIILGTIPLQSVVSMWSLENVQTSQAAATSFATPSAPIMPTAPPLSELCPDIPPPAYEDCFFGGSSLRDQEEGVEMDDSIYTPKYTYYTLKK